MRDRTDCSSDTSGCSTGGGVLDGLDEGRPFLQLRRRRSNCSSSRYFARIRPFELRHIAICDFAAPSLPVDVHREEVNLIPRHYSMKSRVKPGAMQCMCAGDQKSTRHSISSACDVCAPVDCTHIRRSITITINGFPT